MASHAVGLIRDQNLNVHLNGAYVVGKPNISKAALRKGGTGGRKPLGDLSNSVNPTPNQTSKKENSKNFSFTEKKTGPSKLTHDSSKSVSKASDKVQAGGRKALSDISNSVKPHLQETSKKTQTSKLTTLKEDPSQPENIAEEGFLHNHEECIKVQQRAISMNEFLRILGIDDFSKQSASAKEPHISNLMMPMSPSKDFEAGEMTELIEDLSPPKPKQSRKPAAPPSPEPLTYHMQWNDSEYIPSFKLIESP